MPDMSMKVYLGRIVCDAPGHAPSGGRNDYEDDHATRREFLASARQAGWVFHRDGKTTCPECAALARIKEATDAQR